MGTDSIAILVGLGLTVQFLLCYIFYLMGFNKGWKARDEIWKLTYKAIQRLKEKEIQ